MPSNSKSQVPSPKKEIFNRYNCRFTNIYRNDWNRHIEPDHFIYKLIQKNLLGRSDNLSRTRNKKRQIRKIRRKTRWKSEAEASSVCPNREKIRVYKWKQGSLLHDFNVEINVVDAFAALLLGWKREFVRKQDRCTVIDSDPMVDRR